MLVQMNIFAWNIWSRVCLRSQRQCCSAFQFWQFPFHLIWWSSFNSWNSDVGKSNFGAEKSKHLLVFFSSRDSQISCAEHSTIRVYQQGFLSWVWDFGISSQLLVCRLRVRSLNCRKYAILRNRLDNPFYQFSPAHSVNGWYNPGFVFVNNALLFTLDFPHLFSLHTRISWVFVVSVLNQFNVVQARVFLLFPWCR